MICPRCGAELVEHVPNIEWNRHFVCLECDAAYRIEDGDLVPGRNRPEQFRVGE